MLSGQDQQASKTRNTHIGAVLFEIPRLNRDNTIHDRERMAVEYFALNTRHEMTQHLPPTSNMSRWTDYLVVISV